MITSSSKGPCALVPHSPPYTPLSQGATALLSVNFSLHVLESDVSAMFFLFLTFFIQRNYFFPFK